MKTVSQLLFSLIFGVIGLTLAFALMLHFKTAPATAFAYLLFFSTLRSISVFNLTRERVLHFAVASLLCITASFWVLRSNSPLISDRDDASIYSVIWRSAIILLCLLAIPHYASALAARLANPLRRTVI